jgi:hypothetical protein
MEIRNQSRDQSPCQFRNDAGPTSGERIQFRGTFTERVTSQMRCPSVPITGGYLGARETLPPAFIVCLSNHRPFLSTNKDGTRGCFNLRPQYTNTTPLDTIML